MFALVTTKGDAAALVHIEGDDVPRRVRILSGDIIWASSIQFRADIANTDLIVQESRTIGIGATNYHMARIDGEPLHHMVLRKPDYK